MQHNDTQFLSYIVESLIDPEAPKDCYNIERSLDEKGVLLHLWVDSEQAGRIIGKGGSTAQAIRCLLRGLGLRNNAHYSFKITVRGTEGEEITA